MSPHAFGMGVFLCVLVMPPEGLAKPFYIAAPEPIYVLMKTMFDRHEVAARFDAWVEWFGPVELDMLVSEVERILQAVNDARFPAHEPGFFGEQDQRDWLVAVEACRRYLRRLVTQAPGNVGKPPSAIDDIDPLVPAIWEVFELPRDADEKLVQVLADACRAGERAISQSGIRTLKLKKRKQGRKPNDVRWMRIAAAVHNFLYPQAHTRAKDGSGEHYARDRVLRSAIRALTADLGIAVKESTVSNFMARYRKSLSVDGGLIGTQELRRVYDDDVDCTLFDVRQIIESI